MDEIDAIGGRRFSEGTSADREIQRTLMELLNQLDGFDQLGKVCIYMRLNLTIMITYTRKQKYILQLVDEWICISVIGDGYLVDYLTSNVINPSSEKLYNYLRILMVPVLILLAIQKTF